MKKLVAVAILCIAAGSAALAASASGSASALSLQKLISIGPTGGNGAFDAGYFRATADGYTVLFTTRESLDSTDTDTSIDLYKRTGDTTTLISTGPAGGNGTFAVTPGGMSADASHVYFQTQEAMTSDDTDTALDVYERFNNTTTRMSGVGTSGNSSLNDAFFTGNSQDGIKVFFAAYDSLAGTDSDTNRKDVYQYSGGSLTQLSVGGDGPYGADYLGASADGSHVYFQSDEQLTGTDTDGHRDIWDASGGTSTQVSTGPLGGDGPWNSFWGGNTPDGSRVYFQTQEQMVSADTDSTCPNTGGDPILPCTDVYERTGGNTNLVSTSPTSPNGPYNATFSAATADASHVFFQTDEPLVTADTDSGCLDELGNPTKLCIDLYDRTAGNTVLVSTSATSPNSVSRAAYSGSSSNGAHVFFTTDEALVPQDTDGGARDLYDRFAGGTTLASTGPSANNGPYAATFTGASTDGNRVTFTTFETLTPDDTDANWKDVYERSGGQTSLLSTSLLSVGGAFNAETAPGAVSADGTVAWFYTSEQLVTGDTDAFQDVYAGINLSYQRPDSGSQSTFSFVPIFKQCGSGANTPTRSHAAPMAVGSCAPGFPASQVAHLGNQATGQATYSVTAGDGNPFNGDQADVSVVADVADVRSGNGFTGADYNPNPSGADVTLETRLRMTDIANTTTGQSCAPVSSCAATTTEILFRFPVDCSNTADPLIGASCSVNTTADAVTPGFAKEDRVASLQMFRVLLRDSGVNGIRGDSDDQLFGQQGFFVP